MTKTFLRTLCVVGLLPMVAAASDKTPKPMVRLAKAHVAIVKGDQQTALNHLNWCYDNSVNGNTKAFGIRGYVIETMGELAKTFAPARQGLKARRDTAIAKLGKTPKIVPTFFDLLAINRALGDGDRNKKLLSQLQKAGFKQFAARPPGPTPITTGCDACDDRIRTTYEIQRVQTVADALATIATSKTIAELEYDVTVDEEEAILAELADLEEALLKAITLKKQATILRRISFLTKELNDFVRPRGDYLGREIDYYVELIAHVVQYTDATDSTGK